MKIRSRDGRWTVEVIHLEGTGQWLRVAEYGWWTASVRTPQELAQFGIDLSEVEEV